MFKIHRILVPVDFTEVADAAISVALQLANQHEGAEHADAQQHTRDQQQHHRRHHRQRWWRRRQRPRT